MDDLRAFPEDARRAAGFELRRVQQGFQPTDVFYIARFAEGVYVLHAFEKRSRATPAKEIEVARSRFRDSLTARRRVR